MSERVGDKYQEISLPIWMSSSTVYEEKPCQDNNQFNFNQQLQCEQRMTIYNSILFTLLIKFVMNVVN